jgi:hypothetical protein
MKTLSEVLTTVQGHNHASLADLQSHKTNLLPDKPVLEEGMASVCSRLFTGNARCYNGKIKGLEDDDAQLAKRGIDVGHSAKSVAVFSVVDKVDKISADALPVVMCVGINYGQGKDYLKPQPMHAITGMRTNLNSAFKLAGYPSPDPFHLVAANFFPWITSISWQELAANCLHSALLLHAFGYSDPASHLNRLVSLLQPEWLVFHGVGNSVPVLSLQMLNQLGDAQPAVLFCDNLGRHVSKNSVHLL